MGTSRFSNFCLLIIIGTILNPAVNGFNYTEFFLNRNPYMARKLVEGFEDFSAAVNSALAVPGAEKDLTNVRGYAGGSHGYPVLNNTKSGAASGVATLLTVAHEKIWGNMKVPGFDNVLRSVPPALPDLMGILFKAAQEDYNTKIRTLIFTPTLVKTTLSLANLKAEVKQAFFQLPERTMEGINDVIRTRVSGFHTFPDYLQDPLPETTEALMINMKEQKGYWPDYTTTVGRFPYRGSLNSTAENIEMFDLQGDFWYGEDEQFQFVKVPLKATRLQVTLILPKDVKDTVAQSVMRSMDSVQMSRTNLRLRLPSKTFISRSPVTENSSACTEESSTVSSPCMHFLDTLTYTSFSPSEFKFVSLTGAAIDNPYVARLRSQMPFRGLPPLDRWRLLLPPKSHLHQLLHNHQQRRSYHHHFELPRLWRSHASSLSSPRYNSNYGNEQLLIFDRPFYWFVKGNL